MSLTLANGYTVTFVAAAEYGGATVSPTRLTRVTLQRGSASGNQRQRISIAHLGEPFTMTKTVNGQSVTVRREEPFVEIWQPRAGQGGGGSLAIDFIGNAGATALVSGHSGTLTVVGAGVAYSGNATVTDGSVTASVGDVVRGSATFAIPLSTSTAASTVCNCF
jgi:hypothetical protein